MDSILGDSIYTWPEGSHTIGNESIAKYLYMSYENEIGRLNGITGLFNVGDLAMDIKETYEEIVMSTGGEPYSTIGGTVVGTIMKQLWDEDPRGLDSIPEYSGISGYFEKRIGAALEKYEYVENTEYKYLIVSSNTRKEFVKQVQYVRGQVAVQDINMFEDSGSNGLYKRTMLNYLDDVINMNNNFNKSKNALFEKLKQFDRKYK